MVSAPIASHGTTAAWNLGDLALCHGFMPLITDGLTGTLPDPHDGPVRPLEAQRRARMESPSPSPETPYGAARMRDRRIRGRAMHVNCNQQTVLVVKSHRVHRKVSAMRLHGAPLAAMLGGMMLSGTLAACGPSAGPPVTPHRPEAIRISRVAAMHFTSRRTGWAIVTLASNGLQEIAQTHDGGRDWEVSHPIPSGDSAYLNVVSSRIVYVLVHAPTGAVRVLRTLNGGQGWSSAHVPAKGHDQTLVGSFAPATTSWLLSCAPPSLSGTTCELFRTTDGGGEWHPAATFPVSGLIPNGVTFSGADGWITGQNHSDNATEILSTRDGGRIWAPVPLTLPADTATNADTYPVTTHGHGLILPAILYEPQGAGFLLYVRTDGVFRPTVPLPTAASPTAGGRTTLRYSLVGRTVTFVLASPSLYETVTGGKTWTIVNAHVPAWSIMDFVSPNVGYALSSVVKKTPPTLWVTTDGGRKWMRVAYTVTKPLHA